MEKGLLLIGNLDMMINSLSHNNIGAIMIKFKMFLYCFILFIFLISCSSVSNYGYKYEIKNTYDTLITKNNLIVVNHSIIDIDKVSNYYVGLRLKGEYLTCNSGEELRYVLYDERSYFILNVKTGSVKSYELRKLFDKKLLNLGIKNKIKLDYSQFQKVWDKNSHINSKIDFANCESIEYLYPKAKLNI